MQSLEPAGLRTASMNGSSEKRFETSVRRHDFEAAKRRLTIPVLWQQFGLSGQPKKSCRSPFRNDVKPSFSVYADGTRWKDHAEGVGGDAIDFYARLTGLPIRVACREYCNLASGGTAPNPRQTSPPRAHAKPDLTGFGPGELHELHALARLRNVSVESLQLATERGFLLFGTLLGFHCWIVTDSERIAAQARRMDGEDLPELGDLKQRKAHTIRGSVAAWPLGAADVVKGQSVLLVEGGPDLLAAWHFIWCEEREADCSAVALLGASPDIALSALPHLSRARHIRLFPHIDSSGKAAAQKWARQLREAGVERDAFSFTALLRSDGAPVKDLNDCTSIDYDCFEQERVLWGIIP